MQLLTSWEPLEYYLIYGKEATDHIFYNLLLLKPDFLLEQFLHGVKCRDPTYVGLCRVYKQMADL